MAFKEIEDLVNSGKIKTVDPIEFIESGAMYVANCALEKYGYRFFLGVTKDRESCISITYSEEMPSMNELDHKVGRAKLERLEKQKNESIPQSGT